MDSLYILIPIALVFCFLAIRLLLWAIHSGQYDDLEKDAYSILMDEPVPPADPAQHKPPSQEALTNDRATSDSATSDKVQRNQSPLG